MKNTKIDNSMEYVKSIIRKWNHNFRKRYWDNGYYTFLIKEEENAINEEVKLFLESVMKRKKYIVNILDNYVEYNNIFLDRFIIVKEYNFGNGEMIIFFVDKQNVCREAQISIQEYLEINKLFNDFKFLSFNVIKPI